MTTKKKRRAKTKAKRIYVSGRAYDHVQRIYAFADWNIVFMRKPFECVQYIMLPCFHLEGY